MTDEQTVNRLLMSDHARERDDARQDRSETRRTWAEAGVSIALGLIGLVIWTVSMGVAHVG